MRYRVLAKGFSPGNGVRERYQFDLLCTRERAEQIARLYQTHFESKPDGTYTVSVTDRDTSEVIFRESTYLISHGFSMGSYVTNSATYVSNSAYGSHTYNLRSPSWFVNTTGTYA